jgi:site-specific recombinase XerD
MFIDTGIRASELVGLTVENVDLGQQMALVMGKGGRVRAGAVSGSRPQTPCGAI